MQKLLAILVSAWAACSAQVAFADLSGGTSAFDQGDYTTARKLLSDPALAGNGEALWMMARMAHEGWGGPADQVEAYVDLSRIVMNWQEELVDDAVSGRRHVASQMSRAEILSAEARLGAIVEANWGKAALASEVSDAIRALDACSEECDVEAQRLRALGPAARTAIPALEAVMTRDWSWTSRSSYVNALYSIGTTAVPALCRIAEDKVQLAQEGSWNLTQAAYALGALGYAADEARDCLIRVMEGLNSDQPALQEELGTDLSNDPDAMLKEAEYAVAMALYYIGDPDRLSQDAVLAAFSAAKGFKAVMLCAVLGQTYDDLRPAISVAGTVLASGSYEDKGLMLSILAGLTKKPGFADQAAVLLPLLTPLASAPEPDISEMAKQVLEAIGKA